MMTKPDAQSESLRVLQVIDRLVVGPVRVEPNRILAPYVVWQNERSDSFELAYRYEEPVFEPERAGSVNLAEMIAAQVAINYGLFCREMVFHGGYDARDRRFLHEMSENTAREIFVKKFLEPNPFLTGTAKELPSVRRSSYLLARLVFPESENRGRALPDCGAEPPWETSPSKVCVLSSGGKDSLLSYALLKEIGQQVHPIFVNESGRHWFTALNAYRHFASAEPNTARVWTNSDRLFSWMLRHLPFVRSGFARLRWDEYPIRLWTVAVFLFGVLPLLQQRGMGRLVIGNEFDTTDRRSHAGITHYNGLYDQSRYFDRYLSRYFQGKGWHVLQFSILRALSEMLIEKVLVERYPHVQRLQVSCHAAHADQGRIRPCGNCEKCRRIVGMLKALGRDPQACGYSEEQIVRCLASLATRGAMQEADGLEHMALLLGQRGLLPLRGTGPLQARDNPAIMKLRFHSDRSRIDDVPLDLRRPLYSVLLQHASGAVSREGDAWSEVDLLNGPGLMQPRSETAATSIGPQGKQP